MNVNIVLNLNLVVIIVSLITTLTAICSLLYCYFYGHKKVVIAIRLEEDEIIYLKKGKMVDQPET